MREEANTILGAWRSALAVLVVVLVGCTVTFGSGAEAQDAGRTTNTTKPLRPPKDNGYLTVVEQDGRDVTLVGSPPASLAETDLPRSAFELLENGKARPADIRRLESHEVILVIDPSVAAPILSTVRSVLADFVVKLPMEVTIGVIAAADEPTVLAPRGGDAAALEGLSALEATNGPSILGGLDLAVEQFSDNESANRAIVLVNGSGYDRSSGALEATAGAMKEKEALLYRVELHQTSVGISPPRAPGSLGGREVPVTNSRRLLGLLDRLSVELLSQYRVRTRLEGSGPVGVGVQISRDDQTVKTATIVGLPPLLTAPAPVDGSSARAETISKVIALAAIVGLLTLLLLVPPRRARARATRQSTSPVPVGMIAPSTGPPAGIEEGGGHAAAGRRRRSVLVDPRRRHLSGSPRGAAGLGGEQVEGVAAVAELLRRQRRRTRDLWLADDLPAITRDELVALAEARRVPVLHLPPGAVANEARSKDPAGVLAHAAPLPTARLDQLWRSGASTPPLLLGLDGPIGEEALGAVLRIAARTGVSGVVLRRGRSHPITPAVTNAAEGAVELVDVALVGGLVSAAAAMRAGGLALVGIDSSAPRLAELLPLRSRDLSSAPLALLLGADGSLDRGLSNRCDFCASVAPGGARSDLPAVVETALLALSDSSTRFTRL